MKAIRWTLVVAGCVLVVGSSTAFAQAPAAPAAPQPTLWSFLGIPQSAKKMNDNLLNRRGNHPGLEKKPPLKKLADPENLKSPNPAIKKAAEIKRSKAGRSGARPMPPATKTSSWPSAWSTGQAVPYGPRIASESPRFRPQSACVTGPMARIVWTIRFGSSAEPLMEIADSPTPGAHSMLNCPGRKANGARSAGGSRTSVVTSLSSRATDTTRQTIGRIASTVEGTGGATAASVIRGLRARGRELPAHAAGHRVGLARRDDLIVDRQSKLDYIQDGRNFVITHVGVHPAFRGQGVAGRIVEVSLAYARENSLRVVPMCSYAAAFIRRHPEYAELIQQNRSE